MLHTGCVGGFETTVGTALSSVTVRRLAYTDILTDQPTGHTRSPTMKEEQSRAQQCRVEHSSAVQCRAEQSRVERNLTCTCSSASDLRHHLISHIALDIVISILTVESLQYPLPTL